MKTGLALTKKLTAKLQAAAAPKQKIIAEVVLKTLSDLRLKFLGVSLPKVRTEALVVLMVVAGTVFAQTNFFTSILTSPYNTSDAFKLINNYNNLNKKLSEVARAGEAGGSLLPRVLAVASAAEEQGGGYEFIVQEGREPEAETANIITTAGNSAIVKPNYTVSSPFQGNIAIYKVAEGDNPTIIAGRYGIGLPALLRANNLNDASMIKPGQELKVPICDGLIYEMKETDTLDSVLNKFNLGDDEIDYLLNCNDVENFEDLHNIKLAVIPQKNLEIPHAPKPTLVRQTVSNTSGQIALGTASVPSSFSGGSGTLSWPVPASLKITQGYSWRHNGIDISGGGQNPGPTIVAADSCFVEVAGWERGGWGNTVVCNHGNGTKTRYAHMSTIGVSAGQTVSKGEALGRIGSTGRSTGPHLHFTIYKNGQSVNPWNYLD